MTLTVFRQKRRGQIITIRPRFIVLAVMALAGVKGAITLAGILTLPVTLENGSPFPGRELLIFLSMAVILMSLIIAAVGLLLQMICFILQEMAMSGRHLMKLPLTA